MITIFFIVNLLFYKFIIFSFTFQVFLSLSRCAVVRRLRTTGAAAWRSGGGGT